MNRVHFFGRIQVEIFDLRSFGGVEYVKEMILMKIRLL